MPQTGVFFYREGSTIPVLEWLDELRRRNARAYVKCLDLVLLLEQFGHELRRPTADLLEEGIYELRGRIGKVHYRLLYFFHGRNVAILAHSLTKEKEIPKSDLALAIRRKKRFEANPEQHKHLGEIG